MILIVKINDIKILHMIVKDIDVQYIVLLKKKLIKWLFSFVCYKFSEVRVSVHVVCAQVRKYVRMYEHTCYIRLLIFATHPYAIKNEQYVHINIVSVFHTNILFSVLVTIFVIALVITIMRTIKIITEQ